MRRVSFAAAAAALLLSACSTQADPVEVERLDLVAGITLDLSHLYDMLHPVADSQDDAEGEGEPLANAADDTAPARPPADQWARVSSQSMLRDWCSQLDGRLSVRTVDATVHADCAASVEPVAEGRLRSAVIRVPAPDVTLLSELPPFDRGDDQVLDELLASCTEGEEGDCRALFDIAPAGSRYRDRSGIDAEADEDALTLEHPRLAADRIRFDIDLDVSGAGRLVETSSGAAVSQAEGAFAASWSVQRATEPLEVSLAVRVGSWWNVWRALFALLALSSLASLGHLYDIPGRLLTSRTQKTEKSPQQVMHTQPYEQSVPRPPSFADPDSYTSFPAQWADPDDAGYDDFPVEPVGEWDAASGSGMPHPSMPSGALPPHAPSTPPLDVPPAPPPAGWYPDPHDPVQMRWWDGSVWGPAAPR